jgi:hypothetical protein
MATLVLMPTLAQQSGPWHTWGAQAQSCIHHTRNKADLTLIVAQQKGLHHGACPET